MIRTKHSDPRIYQQISGIFRTLTLKIQGASSLQFTESAHEAHNGKLNVVFHRVECQLNVLVQKFDVMDWKSFL